MRCPTSTSFSAVLVDGQGGGAERSLSCCPGGVIGGGTDPRIGGAVLKSGLPAVAENRLFAANGGLLAHGIDSPGLARRAAYYVDRILKGARPGDLPIELPTTLPVVVNLQDGPRARDHRPPVGPAPGHRADPVASELARINLPSLR